MQIPGNEKRLIQKVAKRRQVLDLDAGTARLSPLKGFRGWAFYFTWDSHPRLSHAVPIGTKTNAVTVGTRLQMPSHTGWRCPQMGRFAL